MSTTRPRFDRVERRTLAEAIREQIQQQILEGVLAPGARLPAERELCEEFDVARTSVREAIQGLISLGLVERRGNRSYVVQELPSFDVTALKEQAVRVRDLFEVRRLIELPMTELAACRADDGERAEILALAQLFADDMPLHEFRELDRRFHWVVARASHNALLAEVYGKVLDALFESDEWSTMLEQAPKDAIDRIIASSGAEHRDLADRVAAGDAVSALEAMAHHLDTVEQRIVSQLG